MQGDVDAMFDTITAMPPPMKLQAYSRLFLCFEQRRRRLMGRLRYLSFATRPMHSRLIYGNSDSLISVPLSRHSPRSS